MRWFRLVGATGASAIAAVAIQLVALASLQPADYGYFSIVYLAGAWALSVQLSVVSEAWVRSDRAGLKSDWRSYAAATSYLALIAAFIVALIAAFIPELAPMWWAAGLAVLASVYRSGARFYSMRVGDWPGVMRGDLISAVVAIGAGLAVLWSGAGLPAVMVAWAATSVVGAALSRFSRPFPPSALASWIGRHRKSIAPLLLDSAIMDGAAIGTPYVLAPILGIAQFGVYRGVSNVAAPVRLMLNPLRPKIASLDHGRLTRGSTVALIAAASLVVGTAAAVLLSLLARALPELGMLTELGEFAIPTGVYVGANMLGMTYALVARNHSAPRSIWQGRIIQSGLAIVLPILAAIRFGLAAAIWAYALSFLVAAVVWVVVARKPSPTGDDTDDKPSEGTESLP